MLEVLQGIHLGTAFKLGVTDLQPKILGKPFDEEAPEKKKKALSRSRAKPYHANKRPKQGQAFVDEEHDQLVVPALSAIVFVAASAR